MLVTPDGRALFARASFLAVLLLGLSGCPMGGPQGEPPPTDGQASDEQLEQDSDAMDPGQGDSIGIAGLDSD